MLLLGGLIWGLLTFWFQNIVIWAGSNLKYVVFTRIVFGAAQGIHFPALASISSRNLNTKDRSFFFSAISAGLAIGTLLTGTIGSYMNETFGWSTVFYSIGKTPYMNSKINNQSLFLTRLVKDKRTTYARFDKIMLKI